jgi:hypothetical protein
MQNSLISSLFMSVSNAEINERIDVHILEIKKIAYFCP